MLYLKNFDEFPFSHIHTHTRTHARTHARTHTRTHTLKIIKDK